MTKVINRNNYNHNHKKRSKYYFVTTATIAVIIIAIFFGRYLVDNINFRFWSKQKKEYSAQAKTTTVGLHLEVRMGILSAYLMVPQSVKSSEVRILKDGQIVRKAIVDIVVRDHRAVASGWHAMLCASSLSDSKITNLELVDIQIEGLGGSSLTGVHKASPFEKNESASCVVVASANVGVGRGAFLLKPVFNVYFRPLNNNIKQLNKQTITFNLIIL